MGCVTVIDISTLGPDTIFPYLAIVFVLVLTGAGLPIPEEVPIVAAGVLASGADPGIRFNVTIAAFLACIVGAILGDTLVYAAGRFLGVNFFRRHKWFAKMMHEDREKQMEALILRHGWKVFFAARFMIGVRAPVYMAAGVMRVPLIRFLLIDGIAATIVVGIVFGLSYRYGEQIRWIFQEFTIGVTVLAVVAVLTAMAIFWWRRRRQPPLLAGSAKDANDVEGQDKAAKLPVDDTRAARMSA